MKCRPDYQTCLQVETEEGLKRFIIDQSSRERYKGELFVAAVQLGLYCCKERKHFLFSLFHVVYLVVFEK